MNKIFHPLSTFYRCPAAPLTGVMLTFTLFGCGTQPQPQAVEKIAQDTSSAQESTQKPERDLSFNDVTLEQADQQGRQMWKVKAKEATYSKDQKIAQLQSPSGQLFQDGKPVYNITAQTGEIEQDGEKLFLKGQIVAKAPLHNLVLRGNELEWRPKEDLLIVRNKLTGNHPQLQAVAQEARVKSRAARVELQGKVQAIAKDPTVQMRTEHLIWQMREQKLIGDRPLRIERYEGKKITDRGTANSGEVNLKTKVTTLRQDAQISLLLPPIEVSGNSLSWNMNTKIVSADQPVRIVHIQQQMVVTAKQGRMDLQKEIAYLSGDVNGFGQRRQTLKANSLTWYLPNQLMEANGDVVYRQVDPPASFSGQKAVGKLQEQNIEVSGGNVVTEIVPQQK